MKSIRGTLIKSLVLAAFVLSLASGGVLFLSIRRSMGAQFDQTLSVRAQGLQSLVTRRDDGVLDLDLGTSASSQPPGGGSPDYFELRDAAGRCVARSWPPDASRPPDASALPDGSGLPHGFASPDAAGLPGGLAEGFSTIMLPGGVSGRALTVRFVPQVDPDEDEPQTPVGPTGSRGRSSPGKQAAVFAFPLTLVVAQSREALLLTVRQTGVLIAAATVGLSLSLIAAAVMIVRRGLRHLDDLAAQAQHIDLSQIGLAHPGSAQSDRAQLDRAQFKPGQCDSGQTDPGRGHSAGPGLTEIDLRDSGGAFNQKDAPAELQPIIRRLNALLVRVRATIERERRFSANVAHELRTPLAELRLAADVARRMPGDAAMQHRAVAQAGEIAVQMQSMVAVLSQVVQSPDRPMVVARVPVAIEGVIRRSVARLGPRAAEPRLQLIFPPMRSRAAGSGVVLADAALLVAVVDNLLGNALQYAPAGSQVLAAVSDDGAVVQLRVINDDATLADDDLAHLFDPFWRKDAARSGGVHVGLGLTLAKTYCDAMGASIQASRTAAGQFCMTVALAAAPDAALATAATSATGLNVPVAPGPFAPARHAGGPFTGVPFAAGPKVAGPGVAGPGATPDAVGLDRPAPRPPGGEVDAELAQLLHTVIEPQPTATEAI